MSAATRRATFWLQRSLQRWLVLPFLAAATLLTVIGAAFGAYLIGQTFSWLLSDSVSLGSVMAAHAISGQAEELREAVGAISRLPVAQAVLAGQELPAAGDELLSGLQSLGVDAVNLVRASDGSVLSYGPGSAHPVDSAWRPMPAEVVAVAEDVRRALDAPPISREAWLRVAGEPGQVRLYAVSPVRNGQSVVGLLVASVPLMRTLRGTEESLAGSVVLYNSEGLPAYGPLSADLPGPGQLPALLGKATDPGDESRLFNSVVEGRPYVYAVHPILAGGQRLGFVTVWRASSETTAFARRWQISFVLLVAVATGTVLALSSRLVRRAISPVSAMVDVARAVADGDFSHTMPRDGIGELSVLADAMGDMAAQVERQTGALREQARHSTYLFEASAELGRTLDFEESLQTAAEAIFGLDKVSYVLVLTGRGELGPYVCQAARGLAPEIASQVLGHDYPVPLWGVMARALVSRQPVVIDDIVAQNRPLPGEFNWEVGPGSMLLFPVCGASGPFALLIVGACEPGAFGSGTLGDLVFALARIASHSIQNAHLYREAVRSQEQLVTLQVISRLVASTRQIDRVLDEVMREAADVMGDSQVWLSLREAGSDTQRLYSRPRSVDSWGPVHQDAVAWVTQAGQPIFYNPDYPLVQSPILVHGGPAMCVPLEADEETLGTLVVVSRAPQRVFVEDDMIVLRTLANAAAAALRTRQLAEHYENGFLELAQAWANYSDMHAWGRPGHARRVASNAMLLGSAVELPVALEPVLQVASYLHDIAVASSGEDLRESGVGETAQHAALGAEWLAQAGLDSRIAALVRYHHTARPDLALSDADLGQAATVLALVHAVDAWLSGTSDVRPLTAAEVRDRLAADAGGRFLPTSVERLIELLSTNQLVVP